MLESDKAAEGARGGEAENNDQTVVSSYTLDQ